MKQIYILATILIPLLAACSTPTPAAQTAVPSPTGIPVDDADADEAAELGETAVPSPTGTPTETPAPLPTNTPTSLPTATPAIDVTFAIYNDPEQGFTLAYPETWFVADESFLVFTSNEAFLDGVDASEDGALVAVIPLDPLSYVNQTLFDILDTNVAALAITTAPRVVLASRIVGINGQEAATTTLQGIDEDGNDFTAVYTIFRSGSQLALLFTAISTPLLSEYTAVTDAIQNSFQLTGAPPAQAAIPLTSFVSEDGRFAFAYPTGWVVQAGEAFAAETAVYIAATDDALLDGLDSGEQGAAMRIGMAPADSLGIDPAGGTVAALNTYLETNNLQDQLSSAEPIREQTIGGLPAATLSGQTENGTTLTYVSVTVILAGEDVIFTIGVTPAQTEAVYTSALAAIGGSLVSADSSYGGFVTYTHPNRPLNFTHPATWVISDADPDDLLLASSSEVLTANQFDAGSFLFVFSADIDDTQTPETVVQLFIDNFNLTPTATELTPVTPTTINGRSAATAVYRGDFNRTELRITYTAVAHQSSITVLVSTMPVAETAVIQPILHLITNSLQFGEK